MKRIVLCITVLLVAMLVFSACDRGGDDTPAATPPPVEQDQPDTNQDEPAEQDEPAAEQDEPAPEARGPLCPMPERIVINVGASFGTPEGNVPPGTTPETQTINELLLEHMNIEINYMWMVPSAQGEERFNLAIATGDVPDIMRVNKRNFSEFLQFGMIRDVTDAFNSYLMPLARESFAYHNDAPLHRVSRDGRLYAIPMVRDSFQQVQLIWYRNDWAEALGLSTPTTMDEFHEMAVAFAQNDMSGQHNTTGFGLIDNIVTTWMPDARGLFHGYGAYPGAWIERGGELVFGTIQPEVQQALNRLRRMYADGGIHHEFATMNLDQLVADIAGDRVGLIMGEWWLPAWPFNQNIEMNPNADWRATKIVTPEGTPGTTIIDENNALVFYVVSANAPVGTEEALVRMINLHWDITHNVDALEIYGDRILPENGWVYNWAPAYLNLAAFEQYLNYTMVNEAIRTGDTSAFFTPGQNNLWRAHHVINEGYEFDDMSFTDAWGLYTSRVARHGGWGVTMDVRDAGLFIINRFYGEPTPTELAVFSILNDMWMEFYPRYIMGDLPYEAWDTFVADWLRLGGADWTREVNEQFSAMQ